MLHLDVERGPVVVATVAFGMGMDRDARYAVHAAMPRLLEYYQQGTGRDGAPSDCALSWSPEDEDVWRALIRSQRSPREEAKERRVENVRRVDSLSRAVRIGS